MVKWLLKKIINPDTLIEAGVDAGVRKMNEALAKGDATVVQRVAEAGERLWAIYEKGRALTSLTEAGYRIAQADLEEETGYTLEADAPSGLGEAAATDALPVPNAGRPRGGLPGDGGWRGEAPPRRGRRLPRRGPVRAVPRRRAFVLRRHVVMQHRSQRAS